MWAVIGLKDMYNGGGAVQRAFVHKDGNRAVAEVRLCEFICSMFLCMEGGAVKRVLRGKL